MPPAGYPAFQYLQSGRVRNVGGVVPPTMSVPTRSQSGCRGSLRIQAWRSVTPAGNGVPGETIGRADDSQ